MLMGETFIVPKELVNTTALFVWLRHPSAICSPKARLAYCRGHYMIPLHRDTFSSNSVIFVLFFNDCWGGGVDVDNGRESEHEPCRYFMSFHLQTWREKKKITEALMCLIAQQWQKASWQRLLNLHRLVLHLTICLLSHS